MGVVGWGGVGVGGLLSVAGLVSLSHSKRAGLRPGAGQLDGC